MELAAEQQQQQQQWCHAPSWLSCNTLHCCALQARSNEKRWDFCCNEIHDLYNLIEQYSIEQAEMDRWVPYHHWLW